MSEQYPRELWDDPVFHKGREWGRMERDAEILHQLEQAIDKAELYDENIAGLVEATIIIEGENNE